MGLLGTRKWALASQTWRRCPRLPALCLSLQAESEGWGDAGELNWGDGSW